MNLLQKIKGFSDNQNGNTALAFAVSVFAIVVGAGVAIDTGIAHKTRTKLQNTADSAVLAAAKSGETDQAKLQKLAEEYVGSNGTLNSNLSTSLTLTPNGRVRVGVRTKHDTYFAGIIGKPDIHIAVESEAPLLASEPVNIALVLDVTGSMKGQKLANLKTAATNLVSSLETSEGDAYKVSIVPFAQYVNVGKSQQNANWLEVPNNGTGWVGCVGSRSAPWHLRARYAGKKIPALTGDICPTELLPLTNDTQALKDKIDDFSAKGWTYIPTGLAWGWRSLDANAPLTTPKTKFSGNTKKVLVLMTDGENTKSKNGNAHDGNSKQDANNVTKKLCQNIDGNGIEIYTIAYEITDTATKNLMRNCATKPDMYFDASNSSQLDDAFDAIGSNLIKLRLTH